MFSSLKFSCHLPSSFLSPFSSFIIIIVINIFFLYFFLFSFFIYLLCSIQFVDVVQYLGRLTRDLLANGGARLDAASTDTVRRLLAVVWPGLLRARAGGAGAGRKYLVIMMLVSLVRTALVALSTELARKITLMAYSGRLPLLSSLSRGRLAALAGVVVTTSAVTAAHNWCKDSLAVVWRQALTEHVHERYFNGINFYQLANMQKPRGAILDADERIAREIWSVAQRLSTLVSHLIQAYPTILYFTYRLWRERGLVQAVVPHVYLLLAYEIVQRILPKNIGELYRQQSAG